MNKKKIIQIGIIIFVIVFVTICVAIVQLSKHNLEEAKKDLQETQEKYGWVEKESVDVLVAKFNTQVMDNNSSSLNPASTDYLTESNNEYWYGLIEGVYLVVVPEKYTGDKSTEIVDYTLLYVDKTSKYESDAISYIKHLNCFTFLPLQRYKFIQLCKRICNFARNKTLMSKPRRYQNYKGPKVTDTKQKEKEKSNK